MSLVRFGLVGLLNTAIGFAIIFVALKFGLGDYIANILGYSLGLILSYFVNRRWTFMIQKQASPLEFFRFLVAFCVAYTANLAVLMTFREIGRIDDPIVHLAGLLIYSTLFYFMSRFAVFGSDERGDGIVVCDLIRKVGFAATLVIAAASSLFVIWSTPLCHDVTWQLWVARQILSGAVLYRDIWEINPPLWFWSAEPIVMLAQVWHLNEASLLVLTVWGFAILSALLLGFSASLQPLRRALLVVFSLWMMLIVPLYDFGQREQLALITTLPYAALIARRRNGITVSSASAVIIGVMAAYGFALKHYFALVPLALEMWLFLNLGRQWKWMRIETATLALVGITYLFAIFLFAPEYLTDMVPMIRAAYHGYNGTWEALLLRPWTVFWFLAVGFFVVYKLGNDSESKSLVATLLIAATAYFVAYFIQHKGWLYHSIPVTGTLALAMAVRMTANDLRRLLPAAVGLTMMAYVFVIPFKTGRYFNFFRSDIEMALSTVPTGSPVLVIAADPMWSWPTFQDHGLRWPSRLYSYWMIPAIGHAEMVGPYTNELRSIGEKVRDEAALEMRCAVPDLVMFERRRNYIYQPPSFNVRDYFLRSQEIKELLKQHYKEVDPIPSLYIYRRVTKPVPSGDPACQHPPLIAES